jgi:Fic family protein
MQEFLSVKAFSEANCIAERTVRNYCAEGKIPGAFLTGRTWNIPFDAVLPERKNARKFRNALLQALREQKEMNMKGGIYHRTQIDLTYNSNHIEGSRLTHDQTRYIFETNTIGITEEGVRIDDVMETVNHFRCIDMIIDHATDKLSEGFIKDLHQELKQGTSDSRKDWFRVGDYKKLPNEVGGIETCPPEEVHKQMKALLSAYNQKKSHDLEDIIDFHQRFESIHPFQDGNGRVGRLVMFKECLASAIVPFIITDDLKMYYYCGLHNWPKIKGYLLDSCLTAQDNYKALLDYFKIRY